MQLLIKYCNGGEVVLKNGAVIKIDDRNFKVVERKDYDDVPVMPNIILPMFRKTATSTIVTNGYYDDRGKYVEGSKEITSLIGAVMPLSRDDIRMMEAGQLS